MVHIMTWAQTMLLQLKKASMPPKRIHSRQRFSRPFGLSVMVSHQQVGKFSQKLPSTAIPSQVFKCGAVWQCPGGLPNSCAGGREGTPCAECRQGKGSRRWIAW